MATLTQIRTDLATRLAAIPNLAVYPVIHDGMEPPCVVVGMPDPLEYNLTFGPTAGVYTIPLRLYVSRFDAELAQEALDEFIAPTGLTSVKRAVEDTTVAILSGWHTVTVTKVGEFGAYRLGDVDHLGCEFTTEVVAT